MLKSIAYTNFGLIWAISKIWAKLGPNLGLENPFGGPKTAQIILNTKYRNFILILYQIGINDANFKTLVLILTKADFL